MPADAEITNPMMTKLAKWESQGLPIVYIKTVADLSKAAEILGKSIFANESGDLYTYRRVGEECDFIVCYNQGEQHISLTALFEAYSILEWRPWTGKILQYHDSLLRAGELRIFEISPGKTEIVERKLESVSLAGQPWQLELEKWEMIAPDVLETKKTVIGHKLAALAPWTAVDGLECCSGVGRYKTTLAVKEAVPSLIYIPNITGSLLVTINGRKITGNPLTGYFGIDKEILQAENELEITIGSTLSNYLNNCPLTDFYSKFEPQTYGITDDVQLLYKK